MDHLSGGRAAWNVVTSWDAFTGENFRRGGFLAQEDRYDRAKEFLDTARELWDSGTRGRSSPTRRPGTSSSTPSQGDFAHHGRQFDISGRFNVPRSPQGHPVIFQAGDSDTGREFAAADADCIFTRHGTIEAGQRFYQDVKGRLARYGRAPDELKILPAATFVLGDTEAEADGALRRDPSSAGQRPDRHSLPGAGIERPFQPESAAWACSRASAAKPNNASHWAASAW